GLLKAKDALLAENELGGKGIFRILHAFGQNAVGDVNTVLDDRGAGVAAAERRPPADLGAAGRELVEDARLAPNAVALGPQPLRPIVRPGERGEAEKDSRDEERKAEMCEDQAHAVTLLRDLQWTGALSGADSV